MNAPPIDTEDIRHLAGPVGAAGFYAAHTAMILAARELDDWRSGRRTFESQETSVVAG